MLLQVIDYVCFCVCDHVEIIVYVNKSRLDRQQLLMELMTDSLSSAGGKNIELGVVCIFLCS